MSNPYASPGPEEIIPAAGPTQQGLPGGMVPPNQQWQGGGFPPPGAPFPPQAGQAGLGGYPSPPGYQGLGAYPGQPGYPPPAGAQLQPYAPVPYGAQGTYGPQSAYGAPYGGQPPYQGAFKNPAERSNWMGILSLVLSITGLIFCFFMVLSLGGIGFGISGVMAERKGGATNRGMSIAGIVIGGVGTIVGLMFWGQAIFSTI